MLPLQNVSSLHKKDIRFFKPTVTSKELKSVLERLIQDEIYYGDISKVLEKESSSIFETRYALALSSLNAGYHLCLLSLNIQPKDEIILSTFTSIAAIDTIGYMKATPIVLDIDRQGFHTSTEQIIAAISPQTRIIVLSYPFGSFYDYSDLYTTLAQIDPENKITVIEDISQIISPEYINKTLLHKTAWKIISLHANMPITMGQGSLILTNSLSLYNSAKDFRLHEENQEYKMRFDYSIMDYQAAIGIEQLKRFQLIIERYRTIAKIYLENMQNSRFKTYFKFTNIDTYNIFPIIAEKKVGELIPYFIKNNIDVKTIQYIKPIHRLLGLNNEQFINAEKMGTNTLLLPLYPYLTKNEVDKIVITIKKFY